MKISAITIKAINNNDDADVFPRLFFDCIFFKNAKNKILVKAIEDQIPLCAKQKFQIAF